jgi:Holliday junction DNA helicase RuvB
MIEFTDIKPTFDDDDAASGKFGEKIRARSWDDYVGQEVLKGRLRKIINAAVADHRLLDSMLFTAAPGMGKTTLARIVADEVGDPFHSFKMPISVERLVDFVEGWEGGVLLLDEIHAAPKSFQELLLGAIEDGAIEIDGWKTSTRHVTLLAATTEPEKVIKPLWDRFVYTPRFAPYTDAEMCLVISGMAQRAGVVIDDEVVAGLGRAAGGTPRIAGSLIAAARDLGAIGDSVTVDSVLDLAGIDEDGLSDRHLDYLQVLKLLGGVSGLKNICGMLQLSARVVEDLERLLILRGYVKLQPRGRTLTARASSKLVSPPAPTPLMRRAKALQYR